jgi:hypothetical protein
MAQPLSSKPARDQPRPAGAKHPCRRAAVHAIFVTFGIFANELNRRA